MEAILSERAKGLQERNILREQSGFYRGIIWPRSSPTLTTNGTRLQDYYIPKILAISSIIELAETVKFGVNKGRSNHTERILRRYKVKNADSLIFKSVQSLGYSRISRFLPLLFKRLPRSPCDLSLSELRLKFKDILKIFANLGQSKLLMLRKCQITDIICDPIVKQKYCQTLKLVSPPNLGRANYSDLVDANCKALDHESPELRDLLECTISLSPEIPHLHIDGYFTKTEIHQLKEELGLSHVTISGFARKGRGMYIISK
ncbi:unnamed protein product [Moneuplotes crassus]|uniref:Uncharacterized protein n=1 Tax=Euplotes crassus TaxID=5936 RepID=A0AAD1X658_EUPCR|nr:unnamed protein product [Moneuplotes crassus]